MKMKKLVILLLGILVLSMVSAAVAETVKTAYDDGSLNVRKGPGTNYAVATWVKNGQEITVLERGEKWSKILVNANGKTGYIKTSFIAAAAEPAPAPLPAVYALGSVKTKLAGSSVNVRKGPGTKFAVGFSVKSGAKLSILGESGNWYLVKAENGKTGYISKNYAAKGINGVTTANVNMRSGAGADFASFGVLPAGTKVVLTGVNGSWTQVQAGSIDCYIYSKYVK